MSMRLRMSMFPEGELKEFGGFSIWAPSYQGLLGYSACIFIRGGQEWEGKKSFVRDPAGCLKLLYGDLNFSCFPMSLVCLCGTKHTVQCVSLSELKQKGWCHTNCNAYNVLSFNIKSQKCVQREEIHIFYRTN